MTEMTGAIDVNDVHLRGRLADGVAERELPSGDVLLIFRLTVRRPPDERGTVDSIDCVTTRSRVRRTVQAAANGEELDVTGSLRRRFWRGPSGPESRYAVDVTGVRRIRPVRVKQVAGTAADAAPAGSGAARTAVRRPGRPDAASRGRKPVSA